MSVLVGTPMRGASVYSMYCAGLMGSAGLYGGWMPLTGQSDVYVARCILANQFMASKFDSLVMIDSDIGFTRQNFQDLIECTEPVVSGLYSDKTDDKKPMMRDEFGGEVQTADLPPVGMVKAKLIAGGFLKVDRCVFQAMIDKKVVPSYGGGKHHQFYFGRVWDDHLLSEDYSFSLCVAEAGFQPWVNCGIRLDHDGRRI